MKKYAAAMLLCLASTSALAAPMRDYSLSPEESIRQANTQATTSPSPAIGGVGADGGQQPQADGKDYGVNPNSGHFLDTFCDANYKIGIVRTSMTDCLAQQRETACQQYINLPADAREVMNTVVDCEYAAGENTANAQEDESGIQIAQPRGCKDAPRARISLMKKYYDDQYTSHALLFLEDEALNGSAACISGRR